MGGGQETTEQSVARQRALLDAVMAIAPTAIVRLDRDGRVEFANAMAEVVLGLSAAQITRQAFDDPAWNIVASSGKPMRAQDLPFALVKERLAPVRDARHAIRWPSGRMVQLSINAAPLFDEHGHFDGMVATLTDVTAQEVTEQQRREYQARLANVLDASPMGVHLYRLESDGRLIFTGANRAADELLGVDNSQFVGKTVEEAFPPLAQTEVPERYRACARHGTRWQTRQIDYDDNRIRGAFEVYAFQTSPGNMAAFFWDVTAQLRREEEHRRLQERLASAQRLESIGRLAGGIAHDFNNVLTVILGLTELATSKLSAMDPLASDIREIRFSATRAAALTAQLLAFSRRQVIAPRRIDVNALLGNASQMLRRLIGEDIKFRFEPAERLAAVKADPGKIEQAVMNVVVNARDAMPSGGDVVVTTAEVELDPLQAAPHPDAAPGRYVQIAVRDTGAGMSPETLEHVFEPFFSTKQSGRGTGLGLAMVHGIARQHGGFVDITSAPGAGTTVRLFLPVTEGGAEPVVEEAPAAEPGGIETVLLVEDEGLLRELALRALTARGYTVISAANAGEALAAVERYRGRVDLLLTDVIMPELNGRLLYERLRERLPGLKVLFMSGYTADVIGPHGVLDPGIAFLQKPFALGELCAAVRRVLDGTTVAGRVAPLREGR
jgi:PAS domain S-box-containing protein